MNPGRKTVLLLVSMLLLGMAGCKVDSTSPIASRERAKPDKALYGVWRYKSKDEVVYVHIGPQFSLSTLAKEEGTRTRLIVIDHKASGVTSHEYLAHTSRLGSQRFLNVEMVSEGRVSGYLFVKYALVDGNTLHFWTMDAGALRTAIKAGQIAGEVNEGAMVPDATMTANSDEITKFLHRHGGRLFASRFALKRV